MKKVIAFIFTLSVTIGCVSTKRSIKTSAKYKLPNSFLEHQFTGLLVVNTQNNDTLFNFNSKKYFTPASNTKIFTLYSALQLLPNNIPALKYTTHNDTLFIQGTGDPTLLHTNFADNQTIAFLKPHKNIAVYVNNFEDEKYGQGWAWDDYSYYYQPEKSSFPIYGNVTTIFNTNGGNVIPSYFKDSVIAIPFKKNRDLAHNRFYFSKTRKDTIQIPFKTSGNLLVKLLEKKLNRKISLVTQMPDKKKKILFSVKSDSVFKRMMYDSDNFIAEQLLVVGSSTLSDTLSSDFTRKYILKNYLSDLKQAPRWVDGSGLSRYNLFTPAAMVTVLSKLYKEIPKERLYDFFPAGGMKGPLKNNFSGNFTPYLFAKSGSLSNNYCLSGYLITASGKTLIFSFMNNHFRRSSAELKKEMETILEHIRDTY